ncbi:MAG: restriction endonuclease subunit S [Anaerolineales bacterium]|nr:restriction endonuclease subunit S [Anaerolineales bacterium]
MSDLPENWTGANILELSRMIRGVTYSKNDARDEPSNGLIPILRAMNITERGLVFGDLVYVPRKLVKDEQVIKAGDVVIAISSGSITVVGKAKQTRTDLDAAFGAFCAVLRPVAELDPSYFGHFFGTQHYRFTVSSLARGVNINNLKRDHFAQIEIPLAPLNEQKRIAKKLDSLLARMDSCQTHLERVPQILKRFRQSVLAAATSGRLTEDWREEHKIDNTQWKQTTIGNASLLVTKGASPNWQGVAYVDDPDQTLFVTSENVGNGRLLLEKKKYVENSFNKKQKRSVLQKDDVLTNIVGASIGRTAVFDIDAQANINQAVCVIRVDSALLTNKFLMHYLNSDTGVNFITDGAVDVARANVSLTTISNIPINLPTLEEQAEIVRRVEKLFAYAERLEARYTSASEHVERLTPSLLAKAFRGELVEQEE